jgi:hypothetical protein
MSFHLNKMAGAEPLQCVRSATQQTLLNETQKAVSFLFFHPIAGGFSPQLTKDELTEILLDFYRYPGFP